MPILLHFSLSFQNVRRGIGLTSLVFAVAVWFLTCPVRAEESPVPSLEPGASWEGQADGRTIHDYELPLAAGTYLFLEVEQFGTDVSAILLSSGGGRTATIDGPEGPRATEMLAVVTDSAGTYRLSVTFQTPGRSAGHYVVRVRESRLAKEGDELRVKAVSALTESQRLRSRKESDQAAAKGREALSLWGRLGDGQGETETLNELGQIEAERGEHTKALTWYEKALQRARESSYLAGEASSHSNAGYSHRALEEYDKAIEAYRNALDLWKRVGRTSEQAFVLNRMGLTRNLKGEFEEALRLLNQALGLAEASRDLTEQSNIWNNISGVYLKQGKLSDALKSLEPALALSRKVEETHHQAVLENNLATIYAYRGQFQKALGMYESLVAKAGPAEQGLPLYNLGVTYQELGDLEESLDCYQRSLDGYKVARDLGGQIDALTALGTVHLFLRDPRTALARYEEARKLVTKDRWTIFYSIGLAKLDLKEPTLALESLEKALKIVSEANGRRNTALTWLAMGSAFRDIGDQKRAAEKFEEVIKLGREIQYSTVVALGLLRRARLWRDEGRLIEALSDIEGALEIVESTWRGIAGDDSSTSFMASKRAYYEVAISILMRLDKASPGSAYKRRALEMSERARARGLLNLLAEGRVDVSQGLAADLRQKEDELLDEFSLAQLGLRQARSADELKAWRVKLDDLDKRRKILNLEIRDKHPRYAQVRYPVPRTLPDIQKDLDGRTALLEYALGEESSTLFVVTRDRIHAYEIPPAGKIAEGVRRLRKTLERENRLARSEYLDSAFGLYRDLIAPAAEELENKPNLLIAPDGALYYVPFEAFLTEASEGQGFEALPYLIRKHSVAYIPSASVLAGLREPRGEAPPGDSKLFVAFAPFAEEKSPENRNQSPARAVSGLGTFAPLPASRREVSGIASLYSGASLQFFGKAAKEETVKHSLDISSAQRLHFATHAELNETYPELSALVLADSGETGAGDDGFLNVKEIFNLKLSADFAVLSACKTGLGKQVTGEGLIGLTRAFFYAGVPSLVVSLWNVTDGAAPDLMLDFYRNLDIRRSKSEALQQAKVEMIQKRTFAHPSYWAAFILIGEPGETAPVTGSQVSTPF